MSAAFTQRGSALRAPDWRWTVHINPQPAFDRPRQLERLGARATSPTTMRSGRIARTNFHEVRATRSRRRRRGRGDGPRRYAPVHDRRRELANLPRNSARSDWPGPAARSAGGQRRLPRAGLARDHDSTALLDDGPEETAPRVGDSAFARDQLVERDVAPPCTAAPSADNRSAMGRDGGCETQRVPSSTPRLHHRVLGVELALGLGEHPVEDLTVSRPRWSAQPVRVVARPVSRYVTPRRLRRRPLLRRVATTARSAGRGR